jgi:hypothetical protein
MSVTKLVVEQVTFVSKKSFKEVIGGVQGKIGQPNLPELLQKLKTIKDPKEVRTNT